MRTLSPTMAWLMITHFLLPGVMAFVTRGHGSVHASEKLEKERGRKKLDTVPGAQVHKGKKKGKDEEKRKEATKGTDEEFEDVIEHQLEDIPGAARVLALAPAGRASAGPGRAGCGL